jgi:hypothetical protein
MYHVSGNYVLCLVDVGGEIIFACVALIASVLPCDTWRKRGGLKGGKVAEVLAVNSQLDPMWQGPHLPNYNI